MSATTPQASSLSSTEIAEIVGTVPPPQATRDWRHAFDLLKQMREDPTKTELGMEMVEALGGYFDGDRPFQEFSASAEGMRLLRERPDLPRLLDDRDLLESLPAGSLGREFQAYADRNGITAKSLMEMAERRQEIQGSLDPLRSWFAKRQSVSHDLWHVITGYGTDPIGENAVLLFTRGQGVAGPGLRLLTVLMLFHRNWPVRRFLWTAYRRGRRAASLILAPYEELLPVPLNVVRERFRVGDPLAVHPNGVLEETSDGQVTARASAS
ncbi:MAG: ubiquinone biosynthesis protein COQ4 [bacterium]|nr:ubiquinone biosynthesis protein COQ4 [bacterium]